MDSLKQAFNKSAVKPLECYRKGWETAKKHYWLLLGITFLGMIIGSYVPLAILLGPMMCGIYYCFFRVVKNEKLEFSMLFKGFDYFMDSLIATIPILLITLCLVFFIVIFYLITIFPVLITNSTNFGKENLSSSLSTFLLFGTFFIVFMIVILITTAVTMLFIFTYPLIVDRKLSGVDAILLSLKAAYSNFWRLLALLLLNLLFGILGMCLCYVGTILLFPIHFGAFTEAYRQVFPEIKT